MAGINDAIDDVRTTLAGITGLRNVPTSIPENANVFPFAVAWFGGGTCIPTDNGYKQGLYTIVVQVMTSRRDLSKSSAQMEGTFIADIENALLVDTTLGSNVDTFGELEWSGLQPMRWGDIDTIGYELQIRGVKYRAATST